MATLHTDGARPTIDRIIDVFPSKEQPQIRSMLSQALSGVASQVLLTRIDGQGPRIPACQVMFSTPRGMGMQTMDDSLMNLFTRKLVSADDAYSYAENEAAFEQMLKKFVAPGPGWPTRPHAHRQKSCHATVTKLRQYRYAETLDAAVRPAGNRSGGAGP